MPGSANAACGAGGTAWAACSERVSRVEGQQTVSKQRSSERCIMRRLYRTGAVMTTHVKVLAVLYISLSGLALCAALFLSMAFGTASGIVGQRGRPERRRGRAPHHRHRGTALVVFLVVMSLPGLIAGDRPAQVAAVGAHPRHRRGDPQPHEHSDRHRRRHLRALGPVQQGDGAALRVRSRVRPSWSGSRLVLATAAGPRPWCTIRSTLGRCAIASASGPLLQPRPVAPSSAPSALSARLDFAVRAAARRRQAPSAGCASAPTTKSPR